MCPSTPWIIIGKIRSCSSSIIRQISPREWHCMHFVSQNTDKGHFLPHIHEQWNTQCQLQPTLCPWEKGFKSKGEAKSRSLNWRGSIFIYMQNASVSSCFLSTSEDGWSLQEARNSRNRMLASAISSMLLRKTKWGPEIENIYDITPIRYLVYPTIWLLFTELGEIKGHRLRDKEDFTI